MSDSAEDNRQTVPVYGEQSFDLNSTVSFLVNFTTHRVKDTPSNFKLVDCMVPSEPGGDIPAVTRSDLADQVKLQQEAIGDRLDQLRAVYVVVADTETVPYTYWLTLPPSPSARSQRRIWQALKDGNADTSVPETRSDRRPAAGGVVSALSSLMTLAGGRGSLPEFVTRITATGLHPTPSFTEVRQTARQKLSALGMVFAVSMVLSLNILAAVALGFIILFGLVASLAYLPDIWRQLPVVGSLPYQFRRRVHGALGYDCPCQNAGAADEQVV